MTKRVQRSGATAADVGRHLDITRQRVGQLTDEGVFTRLPDGSYDLDVCRLAYIRWLREEDRRASKSAGANAVSQARAREIEIRIAERQGKLIAFDEACEIVDATAAAYRAAFGGLAARCSRDLNLRRKIQAEVDAAQARVAAIFKRWREERTSAAAQAPKGRRPR